MKTMYKNKSSWQLFTRFLVLIFLVWCIPKTMEAQILAHEGFNYTSLTDGESIANANGGTGWVEAWNSAITATEGAYQVPGLSYNTLKNEGGCVKWVSSAGHYSRSFDATAGGTVNLSDGGTAWFSHIIRFDNGIPGSARTLFFTGTGGGSNDGFGAEFTGSGEIRARITGNLGDASTKTFSYGDGTNPGDSVLVIGRVTYGGTTAGNTTTVDLWMDPADYSSVTALGTADATNSRDGADLGTHSFGNETGVYLRFQDGSTLVDEIRVGLTLDDVTPNIASPNIDPIPDQGQIYDNAGQQTVNLSGITDGLGGTSDITITYSSDNQPVIPDGNISLDYTSPNTTGTLMYEPVIGTSGIVNITLTVSSDAVNDKIETFQVEVVNSSINHEPTIDTILPLTVQSDEGTKTINLTGITDGDINKTQALSVTATSSDEGIITIDNMDYTSDDETGVLTLGITGTLGYSDITITVKDDGGTPDDDTKTRTFRVTVAEPKDDEWVDHFDGPNLKSGWWENEGNYDLAWEEGTMRIDFDKKSWSAFGLDMNGIYDLTGKSYFNLRMKTTDPFELTAYFEDVNGKKAHKNIRVHATDELHNYYMDILDGGNVHADFKIDSVTGMIFIFNGNNDGNYRGTAWYDDLLIGNAATVFANIRAVPVINIPENGSGTFELTDIEFADQVQVPASTDLLENISVTAIENVDEFVHGISTLSFDAKSGVSGLDSIPVTVDGSIGYNNHDFYIKVQVEDNLAPKIDTVAEQDFEVNKMKTIELTGISDGNVTVEQPVSITAVSSNQSMIRDEDITVVYNQGSRNAELQITPQATGTNDTITITVDDGQASNNTVTTEFIANVYNNLNYPPTIDPLDDQFVALPDGMQTLQLTGISDGNGFTQSLSIVGTSSNQDIIPDGNINVNYLGGDVATLNYQPDSFGVADITITVTDDNTGTDNGIQSTSITFTANVAEFEIKNYYIEDFDNVSNWVGAPAYKNISIVDSTSFKAFRVDCQDKNIWGGLWLNLVPPIDLSNHPYLSMEVYIPDTVPRTSFWMWFWDETTENDGRRNGSVGAFDKSVWAESGQWNEIVFDFSGDGEMSDNNGDPINSKNIRQVLFNMHDKEQSWPWPPNYTGTFFIRNLRIGSEAVIPKPLVAPILGSTLFEGAPQQGVAVNVNYTNTLIEAYSSDTTVVKNVTVPSIIDDSDSLHYMPVDTGMAMVNIVAQADGRVDTVSFRVDIVSTDPAGATTIYIDNSQEFQTFRGIGNCNTGKRYTLDSKVDMGVSALRIGMYGHGGKGGIENVNDNDDPYVLNRDALNYSAYDWDFIREYVEKTGVKSVYVSYWSPPAWMKTNLSGAYGYPALGTSTKGTDNRVELHYYDEFAEMAYATVLLFKEEAGIDLTAVTLQNEPLFHEPYGSGILDPEHFRKLTEVVGARLEAEGLSTKVAGPEHVFVGQGHSIPTYMDSIIAHDDADKYTMAFAYHGYDLLGTVSETPDKSFFDACKAKIVEAAYPKEFWMTEGGSIYEHSKDHSFVGTYKGVMANVTGLVGTLEYGDVSLFSYLPWEGNFFDGTARNQNFYATKQVVKHIRPGAVRVSTSIPTLNLRGTSFKTDSNLVSVIICRDAGTALTLDGDTLPDFFRVYQTTEVKQHEYLGLMMKDEILSLPRQSITTLVGKWNDQLPPTIDPIENQSVEVTAGPTTISLTGLSDGDGMTQGLTVSASSNKQFILPDPVVTYNYPENTATLAYDPTGDGLGTVTITVTVIDGGDPKSSVSEEFDIVVTGVNNAPTVDPVGDVNINEDAGQQTITVTGISDGDDGTQGIASIAVTGADPAVISSPQVNYTQGESTATITFNTLADANGNMTLDLMIRDNGGTSGGGVDTVKTSFAVNVAAVNDAPVIDPILIQNAVPDVQKTVNLSGIDDGDPELDQSITITATSLDPAKIPNPVTVNYTGGTDGSVSFTPATGSSGLCSIELTLNDGGGTSNGGVEITLDTFDVNITATADNNPTIDPISDITIPEDTTTVTIDMEGIGDGDAGTQAISVTAESDNSTLVDPEVTYTSNESTGSISFTPSADANGTAEITVTVEDEGGWQTLEVFTVTVLAVNDAPTIDLIADPPAIEMNSGEQTVALTGISDGDAETPQSLNITASSDNTVLIPGVINVSYISGPTGILSYTPANGEAGTASITVMVKDDGGTSNGGIDSNKVTFTVDVIDNNPPTIDPIADISIMEDDSEQTVNLSGIDDGNSGIQTLTVTATSNNQALIPNPAVNYTQGSATGTLTFTPVEDMNGTANIVVRVKDNGMDVTETFSVNVTAINDAPTIDPIDDYELSALLKDIIPKTITGITDGDPEEQSLSVTASSSNESFVSTSIEYTDGSSTGTLILEFDTTVTSGLAIITVTVKDDGGTENGGVDQVEETFTISFGNLIQLAQVNSLLAVYPNPVNDRVYVEMNDDDEFIIRISMYNMVGATILDKSINNISATSLDVSGITNGVYMLKVVTDKEVYIVKLIKE